MKNMIPIFLLVFLSMVTPALADPNWTGMEVEDFENGWHGWSTDNGVWQIGEPNSGS